MKCSEARRVMASSQTTAGEWSKASDHIKHCRKCSAYELQRHLNNDGLLPPVILDSQKAAEGKTEELNRRLPPRS